MGHYDDCYASDDYRQMNSKEKEPYFEEFRKMLNKNGVVWAYFDDVGGRLLVEFYNTYKDELKLTRDRSICEPGMICIDDTKTITVRQDNSKRIHYVLDDVEGE